MKLPGRKIIDNIEKIETKRWLHFAKYDLTTLWWELKLFPIRDIKDRIEMKVNK